MPTTLDMTAFDRGVRPVAQMVFPEKAQAVLGFRPAPELQQRIEELAEKSTEGRLTEAEQAEYEGYVRANKFIAVLQRLARQMIATPA
jgi:predicted transcriptional regulator